MPDTETLKGPYGLSALYLAWGGIHLLLDLLSTSTTPRSLAFGGLLVLVGGVRMSTRNTVLDATGFRAAGIRRRRYLWKDVESVKTNQTPPVRDIVIAVEGRKRPIWIRERRQGADFAAVHGRWLAARGAVEPA